MTEREKILSFHDVTLPVGPEFDTGLETLSFDLAPGAFMLVRVETGRPRLPLTDGAGGLIAPAAGRVLFMGDDWQQIGPDRAAAHRARIGRIFESGGWLSNLNVTENVALAQLHHSKQPTQAIYEDAETLATSFGLDEVPKARPTWVPPEDLCRAGWVRALLGKPDLLLFEQPLHEVRVEIGTLLVDAVQAALDRGAAAIVTTSAADRWSRIEASARLSFSVSGSTLVPWSETDA